MAGLWQQWSRPFAEPTGWCTVCHSGAAGCSKFYAWDPYAYNQLGITITRQCFNTNHHWPRNWCFLAVVLDQCYLLFLNMNSIMTCTSTYNRKYKHTDIYIYIYIIYTVYIYIYIWIYIPAIDENVYIYISWWTCLAYNVKHHVFNVQLPWAQLQ